ncbi:MAG TPA: TetR/AcrR family transcriptional regulator [Actinomycetota bacterium]|nr:TetR/AcrR family transcriptional regulator [Actinomycetota bacterium]
MTASRRANPTYYGGDLRRDLLDTALELIAQEGPSAVSLRALARRLGVSHAAPANHFPDKAALFTAIAVEGFGLLAEAIEDGVRQLGPDATAGQRFRAAGRAYTGFALAHPAHFAVMWQRDLLHQDDPKLVAAGDTTFELLLGGVRDIQSEGWAAGRDPQAVAYLAWSVVHGLAALWLGGSLQRGQRSFDEIAGEVGALLGSVLSPRPASAT